MPSSPAHERARIVRHASALALDLPAAIVRALDLHEGDEVEIRARGANRLEVVRMASGPDALARLRRFRGRLPAGGPVGRDESVS
ncbi:AbrB/MazE/SpoVT family DNA-binding domain-containing protein [Burkholderia plantarii]|uniref:AbrB/MazE/SpoVT family DNA-binding domain-containing protein n=1 Tax=Burkholderia plantarii TaxID=41899 RepID=UPI00272B0A41|nr:AbrB/MazE/SpoVT family DNA-binding domain-containing protein [Burkholderia plantarii]WLE62897.1 AbrB/MazE/SpoVT family DNA-binding domain-containing protein [Burkholderia plantarii]